MTTLNNETTHPERRLRYENTVEIEERTGKTKQREDCVLRRFYHLREQEETPEYMLACSLKKYLLEQKKMESMLNASGRDNLENLVAFPDTGSFSVVQQEHHDVKEKGRYVRDHFIIVEGTGEELVTAEQFFMGSGYRFIDAKTGSDKDNMGKFLGNLRAVHKEDIPSRYALARDYLGNLKQRIKSHVERYIDVYAVLGILTGILLGGYVLTSVMRATDRNETRGAFIIMKEDFLGRK